MPGILGLCFSPVGKAQERRADAFPRYRVIQAADPKTFLEEINGAAGQGYQLAGATEALDQFLSAVLERGESTPERRTYLLIRLAGSQGKPAKPGKVKAEVADRLESAAAKGFHLAMMIGSARALVPGMALMESNTASQGLYEYAVVAPGRFGQYKNVEILRLAAAGYRWVATSSTRGSLLFFEKLPGASGSPGAAVGRASTSSLKRIDFPDDNMVCAELPGKQPYKSATGGARAVHFFAYPPQMLSAMMQTSMPQAPNEYVVVKPRNSGPPTAVRARMPQVGASDLTELGQEGFRMLRLNSAAPPFVMEKARGDIRHYEYEFASSPKVSELTEKLNSPSLAAFHLAKMEVGEYGLLVVMEKSDPPQP